MNSILQVYTQHRVEVRAVVRFAHQLEGIYARQGRGEHVAEVDSSLVRSIEGRAGRGLREGGLTPAKLVGRVLVDLWHAVRGADDDRCPGVHVISGQLERVGFVVVSRGVIIGE